MKIYNVLYLLSYNLFAGASIHFSDGGGGAKVRKISKFSGHSKLFQYKVLRTFQLKIVYKKQVYSKQLSVGLMVRSTLRNICKKSTKTMFWLLIGSYL